MNPVKATASTSRRVLLLGALIATALASTAAAHDGPHPPPLGGPGPVTLPAPPPFTAIVPLPEPEAHLCTPRMMNQAGVHHWFVKADGDHASVTLVTQKVNPMEQGTMRAEVFAPGGGAPILVWTQPMPTGSQPDIEVEKHFAAAPGAVYTIRLTLEQPPLPTPSARHYQMHFHGIVGAALNSPTSDQIEESGFTRWYVYGAEAETVRVRARSQGLMAPGAFAKLTLRDPDGNVRDVRMASGPMGVGYDETLTGTGAAGLWTVEVEGDHHYVLDKQSGADRGIYLTWLSYGTGEIGGSVSWTGGFTPAPAADLTFANTSTGQVLQVPHVSGPFVFRLPVGRYTVTAAVPAGQSYVLSPSSVDLVLSCDDRRQAFFAALSAGKVTAGNLTTSNKGRGGFNVQSDGTAVKGELQFHGTGGTFHAHVIDALAVSPDRKMAWFSGIGTDGRRFRALVADNGEPGRDDRFTLWIDGVLQTGDGSLKGGNVQIHR